MIAPAIHQRPFLLMPQMSQGIVLILAFYGKPCASYCPGRPLFL